MYQTLWGLCEEEKCIKTALGKNEVPRGKLQKGEMKVKGLQKLGGLPKSVLVGFRMVSA